MKINQLTQGILVALLLGSSVVSAEEYPAADFKPKIVFSDASATTKAVAPAAKKEETSAESDAAHPAANFQPKVVFSDNSYKHSDAAPSANSSSKAPVSSVASTAKETSSVAENSSDSSEKPASNNLPLFAVLAAVAAFVFFGRKSGSTAAPASTSDSSSTAPVIDNDGLTGVARYLEKVSPTKTGVAKYLEKQQSTPMTGVAKYMAKQVIRDKQS